MRERPLVLVVITRIVGWHPTRLEARAQARERAKIALADHGDAGLEEHRRRDADALLVAPRLDESTARGDHLTAARGTHVGEERELGPARSEEHTSELQSRLHLVC